MSKYGFSFSWKRAIGVSSAKAKLSRQVGIPLSKSGRRRKAGKAMGYCIVLAFASAIVIATLFFSLSALAHSGGLDRLGCHHDRKRGGYHCHKGPLAGRSFNSKQAALDALQRKRNSQKHKEDRTKKKESKEE